MAVLIGERLRPPCPAALVLVGLGVLGVIVIQGMAAPPPLVAPQDVQLP